MSRQRLALSRTAPAPPVPSPCPSALCILQNIARPPQLLSGAVLSKSFTRCMLQCIWFPYLNLLEPWNWVVVINCLTGAHLIYPHMLSKSRRPETMNGPLMFLPALNQGRWVRGPGASHLANSGYSLSPPRFLTEVVSRFCSIFLLLPMPMKLSTGGRHPKLYNKINATCHFYLFYTWPSLRQLTWSRLLSGDNDLRTSSPSGPDVAVANRKSCC